MNMRGLHDWVRERMNTNPLSAARVLNACNGVPKHWASEIANLSTAMALAASLAAMELQRIVELHSESRA